jgi:membrane protein YdbS with pleckstrin-like domain
MPLLINKDGKELGPYSLDEAREMVLSGELDAADWAWPDGANEWVHLKDIPGFASTGPGKPTTPPSTKPGSGLPAAAGEEELWSGHPSQVLALRTYLLWGLMIVAAIAGGVVFAPAHFMLVFVFAFVILVAVFKMTWAYLHVQSLEYVVTTQRVRIVSGIFSKDIQEIELFRVKDTMAKQSLYLRLFGLGTITVISGDERHPQLVLSGVPKPLELRERLRQEVMTLRQRFGVRELDVM